MGSSTNRSETMWCKRLQTTLTDLFVRALFSPSNVTSFWVNKITCTFGNIAFEVRVLFKLQINNFSVTTMTTTTINRVLDQCVLIYRLCVHFHYFLLTFGANSKYIFSRRYLPEEYSFKVDFVCVCRNCGHNTQALHVLHWWYKCMLITVIENEISH